MQILGLYPRDAYTQVRGTDEMWVWVAGVRDYRLLPGCYWPLHSLDECKFVSFTTYSFRRKVACTCFENIEKRMPKGSIRNDVNRAHTRTVSWKHTSLFRCREALMLRQYDLWSISVVCESRWRRTTSQKSHNKGNTTRTSYTPSYLLLCD
jgi:hypothetical protein